MDITPSQLLRYQLGPTSPPRRDRTPIEVIVTRARTDYTMVSMAGMQEDGTLCLKDQYDNDIPDNVVRESLVPFHYDEVEPGQLVCVRGGRGPMTVRVSRKLPLDHNRHQDLYELETVVRNANGELEKGETTMKRRQVFEFPGSFPVVPLAMDAVLIPGQTVLLAHGGIYCFPENCEKYRVFRFQVTKFLSQTPIRDPLHRDNSTWRAQLWVWMLDKSRDELCVRGFIFTFRNTSKCISNKYEWQDLNQSLMFKRSFLSQEGMLQNLV